MGTANRKLLNIELGRMTPEQARNHPQRNVLLQCVGASEVIIPEFEYGEYKEDLLPEYGGEST